MHFFRCARGICAVGQGGGVSRELDVASSPINDHVMPNTVSAAESESPTFFTDLTKTGLSTDPSRDPATGGTARDRRPTNSVGNVAAWIGLG